MFPQKFINKPVVIEAVQLTRVNIYEVATQIIPSPEISSAWSPSGNPQIFLKTLEGIMIANVGDWIIKGINGEFYPCKPDIFEKTYELVMENK